MSTSLLMTGVGAAGVAAAPTTRTDDFSANTIADYRAGYGSIANWTISGGLLSITASGDQSIKLNQPGVTGDFSAVVKVNLGSSLPSYFGLFTEQQTATSPSIFFWYNTGGTLKLDGNSWPGWSGNQAVAWSPSVSTTYWLKVERSGTSITGNVYDQDPVANPGAVAIKTLSATATTGQAARPSIYTNAPNGVTFDDFYYPL